MPPTNQQLSPPKSRSQTFVEALIAIDACAICYQLRSSPNSPLCRTCRRGFHVDCFNSFVGHAANNVPSCPECRIPEEGTFGPDSIAHIRALARVGVIARSQPVLPGPQTQPATQSSVAPLPSSTQPYSVSLSGSSINAQAQGTQTVSSNPEQQAQQVQKPRQSTQLNKASKRQRPKESAELQARPNHQITAARGETRERKRQRTEEPMPSQATPDRTASNTSNVQQGRAISTASLLVGDCPRGNGLLGQLAADASRLTSISDHHTSSSDHKRDFSRPTSPQADHLAANGRTETRRSTVDILPESNVRQVEFGRRKDLIRTAQQQIGDSLFASDDAVLLQRKSSSPTDIDAVRIANRYAVVETLQNGDGQEVVGDRSGWYYSLKKEKDRQNSKWRHDGQPDLVLWRQERLQAANTENKDQAQNEEGTEKDRSKGQGSVPGQDKRMGVDRRQRTKGDEDMLDLDEALARG